ncbi:helix-turn-helix domain-containing protein [Raoultibacter phocaeensis]|uniref:helix-turn-helix domain-containing protein n=1 Tax=Raoultibacter phocaeensis TaxID=2479841 RepID=UPI00111AE6ED|nr:helix-turn-helix transcriptional regulator [Raoultibacter phocaeensis]
MDARTTGRFIALKRKTLGLTQEQLASELGITGKAVSKWETGRCLPDGSIMEPLCERLHVTLNELLSGRDIESGRENAMSEETVRQALNAVEQLQREKRMLVGLLIIMLGFVTLTIGQTLPDSSTSEVMDFLSGFLVGMSIVEMLVGIFVTIRNLVNPK